MEQVIELETSKQFFYKKVIRIGLPITLSQLLMSLLSFVDTLMVSVLGDNAISAVAIGANFYFLTFMINFGLISGLSIFFAQFWGNKEIENIQKTFLVTLFSSLMLTSVFVILGVFFSDFVVGLYNNTPNLADRAIIQDLGISYIRVAAPGYFFTAFSFIIIMMMRSMERVIFPQIVTIITVLLNTLFNFTLISGNFGFPALGVTGAAVATLVSSFIGAMILLIYFLRSKEEVFTFKFSLIKQIDKLFLRKTLFKAFPVMANEAFWGLGMSMYLIAFSAISDTSLASYHVANLIMGVFWVFNAGISSACAIMLGNKLGESNHEVAKSWGNRFVRLSFVFGVIMGVLLFISSPYIPQSFSDASPLAKENATLILRVFSFFVPIKFVNAIHIIGTLRSGGDTTFTFFAEVGVLWIIGVPLAFILSYYTTLPIYIIVLIVNLEEVIKFVIVNIRFFTYKWVNTLSDKKNNIQ